jgi:tripartite-type tricarboxylate transporter receptor subunit TctC
MAEGNADKGGQNDAAAWPKQAINLVVAFGAGGSSDLNARVIAKYLQKELGKSIAITNVCSSGGTIGTAQVRDAKPDGYTVLVQQISMNVSQASGMVDYGFKDLAPVCVFAKLVDQVMVCRSDAPYNTIKELIAYSQQNPSQVKLAADVGASTMWIAIALQNAGAKLNVVSSGGSGERLQLLLGGHIDVMPMPYNLIADYVKTGQFKVIGTTGPKRAPLAPDALTLPESGVDCAYDYNITFFMPKGTDTAIIEKFSKTVEKIVTTDKDYQKELPPLMQEPWYMDTKATTDYYTTELNALMAISDKLRGK